MTVCKEKSTWYKMGHLQIIVQSLLNIQFSTKDN